MRRWNSDAVARIVFFAALAFLIFLAGVMVSVANVFPANYVKNAYRGGTALYEKLNLQRNRYATDLWVHERDGRRGVTVHDADRMQPGLTLYTTGEAPKAVLMAPDGTVLHEWHQPFSAIWDRTSAVRDPVPDDHMFFHTAKVSPNGDLLAVYTGVGDSPYGYGLVRLDRDSNVIWKNLDHFHHDFDVDPQGRIYALTHAYRTEPVEHTDHFKYPLLDDYLVVLAPDGQELRRISLLDTVNRSHQRRLLWRIAFYSMEDPLHTNAVEVLTREKAERLREKIPQAAEGQVLLSFRELDGGTLGLLDLEQERLVWALRGPWMAQHDPDILPNGNIILFDNYGHYGKEGESRVVEIDPATGALVWQYVGEVDNPLQSRIRSDQQPQPNGNVLITESDAGRLLEVTRDGEIVWEFVNPVRGGSDNKQIPILSSVQRVDPATLAPEFRASLEVGEIMVKETSTQ